MLLKAGLLQLGPGKTLVERFDTDNIEALVEGYNFDRSRGFYCCVCYRTLPMSVVQVWVVCGHLICESCGKQQVRLAGHSCPQCRAHSVLARREVDFAEHVSDVSSDWTPPNSAGEGSNDDEAAGAGDGDEVMEEVKGEPAPARNIYARRPGRDDAEAPDAPPGTKGKTKAEL